MTLSPTAIRSVFAQETEEVFIPLIALSHPDLTVPIRVCRHSTDIDHLGDTYIAFPLDITFPDEFHDRLAVAQLTIDNVSREIGQAIREVQSALEVTIKVVRYAEPDLVEASLPRFFLRNVTWDAASVSGELVIDDLIREPFPAGAFQPSTFPGLW